MPYNERYEQLSADERRQTIDDSIATLAENVEAREVRPDEQLRYAQWFMATKSDAEAADMLHALNARAAKTRFKATVSILVGLVLALAILVGELWSDASASRIAGVLAVVGGVLVFNVWSRRRSKPLPAATC